MFAILSLLCVSVGAVCGYGHGHHGRGYHGLRGHEGPDVTQAPVTVTAAGSVRGSWLWSRRGRPIQAYRGVRYAEPPTGELRFQPPKLVTSYKGEFDASEDGPACPQPTYGDYYVDEDCLRLNVYTPGKRSKPLPVIIFIHAGGFYSVSGRSDVAGPEYLLDKDVVLVTINYRLATLGFISTGDALAPGNLGFKDQVAALRWVQQNIATFGGDPNLVTLTGYSAGGFSTMLHTVSPMSKGLFHRAISMSGSPINQIKLPSHQRHLAVRQAGLLNCPTDTNEKIMTCLKSKTSKELGDSLDQMFEFGYDPVLLWAPIIELDFGQERFLTMDPLEAMQQGKMHTVPYIVSQTQDEFYWKAFSILVNDTLTRTMDEDWKRIAPISFYLDEPSETASTSLRREYLDNRPLSNDTRTAADLGKLYSDAIIGYGAHLLSNALAVYSSAPTYYYEFGYIGNHSHYEDPNTKKPLGAAHHDDLIYLFTINYTFPLIQVSDSQDSKMVDLMTDIWYQFAKHGDPNVPRLDTTWPRMEHASRRYLRVDSPPVVGSKLFEHRFKVWEDLYCHGSHCTNK